MYFKKSSSVIIALLFMQIIFSQEVKNESQKPHFIGKPSKVEYVASIASRIDNLVRPNLQQQKEMLEQLIDEAIEKAEKELRELQLAYSEMELS